MKLGTLFLIICIIITVFNLDFWQKYQQQTITMPHPSLEIADIPLTQILDELGGMTSCLQWQYDEERKGWVIEGTYWDEETGQIKDLYKFIPDD